MGLLHAQIASIRDVTIDVRDDTDMREVNSLVGVLLERRELIKARLSTLSAVCDKVHNVPSALISIVASFTWHPDLFATTRNMIPRTSMLIRAILDPWKIKNLNAQLYLEMAEVADRVEDTYDVIFVIVSTRQDPARMNVFAQMFE